MKASVSKTWLFGAVSLLSLVAATSSIAAEAVDAAAPVEDRGVSEIIVTGSRSGQRTVQNSVVPVDVLSAQAVTQANKPTLLDTLNSLLPSFNLPNVGNVDVGSMIRAGQLRGLNASHTLVLVDGKRRHDTAFLGAGGFGGAAPADLSLIASAGIDHIEVLRDGASAIYGSDAIAGVINIITKKSSEGGSFSARDGQYYAGDGLTQGYKIDQGFKLGSQGGHVHVSAEYDSQAVVSRNSPVPSTYLYYFPLNASGQQILPSGSLSSNPTLPAGATPNPKEATRNNQAWITQGRSQYQTGEGAIDVGLPLNDNVEAYGFATVAHRDGRSPQNFRTPNRDEDVRGIYPDGYTPVDGIIETDYEATGGLRGKAGSWDWDLSTDYGSDNVAVHMYNDLNPTYGLGSQTSFYIGDLSYQQWLTNLDLRRTFSTAWPIDVSAGAEYRREYYRLQHGDLQSYTNGGVPVLDGPNQGKVLSASLGGSQSIPGYRPQDEQNTQRGAASAYVGGVIHPTSKFQIDLAARYENYSDFGDTVTGRISSRYDFSPLLSVRGTVSNGFQAPALAAEAYKNTTNTSANSVINHVLQVTSPQAAALGAQPLKPEKSLNYSLGTVSQLPYGINLAIDLYHIDVKGRIAQSTTFNQQTYPGSNVLVAAAGFDPNDGISYFINAADTRTQGVDITLDGAYNFDAAGRIRWSYAANFNDTKVTAVAATPAVLARLNIPLFSPTAAFNLENQAPKSKHIFTVDWNLGPWGAQFRETRYGDIKRFGTVSSIATSGPYAGQSEIRYDIGGLWVTDLEVSYKVTEKLRLTLAGNNIFGVTPSRLPTPLLSAFQSYSYANNGPIGPEGGFYSATVTYAW
jgi:iron complex outermembrane receptor protein